MSKQVIRTLLAVAIVAGILGACRSKHLAASPKRFKSGNADSTLVIQHVDTMIRWNQRNITQGYMSAARRMSVREHYETAFTELENMLDQHSPLDFKRAVFVSENAYFQDSLNYPEYLKNIASYVKICNGIAERCSFKGYSYPDSMKLKKNFAIFSFMKDTVNIGAGLQIMPYEYDFDDNQGLKQWSSTFVTKMMRTSIGNCHSMPYLYKILANELNTDAYLSMAPNHIYLKHRSKRLGWYNTELTSGAFPTDAWVKASGYITMDAIRSGVYMDTLSQLQSVALCVYDLAKGYSLKTGNYTDGFIIKCCDLVLRYHPNNINAIILKAETLKQNYDLLTKSGKTEQAIACYNQMQPLYVQGLKLGYRHMPQEMYLAWLSSVQQEKGKYQNQEINRTFNSTKP
jgi:hypothetical protein